VSSAAPNGSQPFQILHPLRRYAVSPLADPPRERVEVGKFVILSMLLHVLFIVLFGDSTGGGASRASQMLGGFSASLQARVTNNAPVSPSIKSTSANSANVNPRTMQPVQPAQIEPLKPSVPSVPSAPSASSALPAENSEATKTVEPPPQSATTAPTPPIVPDKITVPDALPTLSKPVVKPVTEFVIPPSVVSPKAAVEAKPAAEALPPIDPLPPLLRAQPLTVPKPIELNAAPSVSREFAPYVPPTIAAPIASPTLPPSITPISPAAPAAPIAPMVLPPVTPLDLPSIAAPKMEREFAAPANIDVPESRQPMVVPPPIANIAPTTAPKTEREFVPYVAPTVTPTAAPVAAPAPTSAPASASTAPAQSAPAAPSTTNAPSTERAPVSATPGSPAPSSTKSTDDIFGPRRDTPTTPAKSLDLDAARKSAREGGSEPRNERSGPRTLLPFPTAPKPAVKSDITKIFDKALKRPDCKEAYSDMGLAAVIPLVRDAIKQDGCKW
jgi:hypothetical protein